MPLTSVIGPLPYRLALAGGWIDQPFVSRLNPEPPGSMVVVSLEPDVRYMERCGLATGTRKVAQRLWPMGLPAGDRMEQVRALYRAENGDRPDPSGSQDMIGLIYPGICRLDYRADYEGGFFPVHIEQCLDPAVAAWLEGVLHLIPVNQRPEGYHPLGEQNLTPDGVRALGRTGADCFDAIVRRDAGALGAAMNACMACWEALLPRTVVHPLVGIDLRGLLAWYQRRHAGAMYSGCGGGYLIVVSEAPPPGSAQVRIRLGDPTTQEG